MGIFRDKLNMIKQGMHNISNVIEGNLNYYANEFGLLSEDKQQEAERRYSICNDCPLNSKNMKSQTFYKTDRTDEHCMACLCPIEKKVMAMEERCGVSQITNLHDQNNNQIIFWWTPAWLEYTK